MLTINAFDPSFSSAPGFAGQPLAYLGEGPEIGKSYGYRITGFVTHEPLRRIERLKRVMRSFSAGLSSLRQMTANAPAALRRGRLDARFHGLGLNMNTFRHRLSWLQVPVSLVWRRLAKPILQIAVYAALRYPATMLALMLACFLGSLMLRGGLFPADEAVEAAMELRLTTGTIGAVDGAATRSRVWKSAKGRSLPIFALEAPEFSMLAQSYSIRTRAEAREDSLSWSEQKAGDQKTAETSWPSPAPLVLIVAQRQFGADGEAASLYLDTTRRAAEYGLSVMRAAVPSDLATKFGMVEVADVILSADAATPEEQSRSCLAFRHAKDPAFFRLTGWLCAPRDRVVERPALAALIDRLSLIGASNDIRLHQIFVDADLARAASTAQRVARKPMPWLDQSGEKPQLKGERLVKSGVKRS